jgi:hypothetical protein
MSKARPIRVAATATPAGIEPVVVPGSLTSTATARRLRMAGFSAEEAGNLVAHLSGLRVARKAWTVGEVDRLLFLRSMVQSGRIEP